MSPCVVLASPLRDLQETFCARYALDHALPPPHSSDTHQRACLHALHAHKMPQRCARSPCLSATMRRGAPGRPSRARFRPASAAQAPHGAGHIILQAAGTADCSSARPPDLPTARPAFQPLHALRRQRCAIRYVIFEQFALAVMTKSIVWKKVTNRCIWISFSSPCPGYETT